jgi:nucleoside-diphosphate-sugar epimerase
MIDRVLVTGAAGFIGSNLCRRLVAEGSEVVGFDDLSDGSLENLRDVPEVRLVEADLRDASSVSAAANGCRIIFHQGAKRSVPRSMRDPATTTAVNVQGTLNVLLAARESNAVVVSASSSSVFGDQDHFPLTESMELRPRSPYAASKLAGEVLCASFWRAFAVRSASMRYFNVYGPGQDPASEYAAVVPRFIVACLQGARPVVHGDGEQSRDFTYIDDVVEANVQAARTMAATEGTAFNIGGGGVPTSVNRLLTIVAGLCGAEPDPIHESAREGDVLMTQADISLAHRMFGYTPKVGIDEGLRRTVESFRTGA